MGLNPTLTFPRRSSSSVIERVLHYNCTRSIARAEPVNTMALLSLKHFQNGDALLPMDTSLENSPLRSLLTNGDDVSELAASFMGPGPWSLHWDLKLPESCSELHFSNSNLASSINVSHTLKISMRVEKGSGGSEEGETEGVEGANKKKRLFDIIVKMPVHILSVKPINNLVYIRADVLDSADVIVIGRRCRAIPRRSPTTSRPHKVVHVFSKVERESTPILSTSVTARGTLQPAPATCLMTLIALWKVGPGQHAACFLSKTLALRG
jgi:hypothetical protein